MASDDRSATNGISTEQPATVRRWSAVLGLELPAESSVLREVRQLAGDRNVRISQIAEIAIQDPVTTLELIRVANATFFSGDKPAITTVQTAVIRLGSETLVRIFDSLAARPPIEDPDIARELEKLRALSRRASIVSRILTSYTQRDIADVAQTTGLMAYFGHMIACAHFGFDYIELVQQKRRHSVQYRLQSDSGFDMAGIHLEYLRKRGLPAALFYGLDRELKCKTPGQSNLRFVVESAVELTEAHEEGKLSRFAPGRPLPAKSSIRLLKISDNQYPEMFEEIDSFLHGRSKRDLNSEAEDLSEGILPEDFDDLFGPHIEEDEIFQDDAHSKTTSVGAPTLASAPTVILRRDKFERAGSKQPTMVLTRHGFQGYDAKATPTNFIEETPEKIDEEVQALGDDARAVLNLISSLCQSSRSSHELLVRLMNLLISDGPFVRAALIVLATEKQSAEIHTAVGEGFVDGESVSVKDPLSPLAMCLTKIKSFNAQNMHDLLAPFGVSAYAVSPIRVKHDAPVVLYADCGLDRPLPLEARKVFRLVVGLLNQTLPRLQGSLPSSGKVENAKSRRPELRGLT